MSRFAMAVIVVAVFGMGQAEAAAPTAEDYYKFAEYWIGQWDGTFKEDGKVFRAVVSIKWSPTKRCQVVTVMRGDETTRHALWGFDPETKRWRGIAFNADGSYTLNVHGPEMLKAKYGKPFKTEMKGAKADGSSVIGTWTTTLIDKNTYELKVYEFEGDKRTLVLEIHLERKP